MPKLLYIFEVDPIDFERATTFAAILSDPYSLFACLLFHLPYGRCHPSYKQRQIAKLIFYHYIYSREVY